MQLPTRRAGAGRSPFARPIIRRLSSVARRLSPFPPWARPVLLAGLPLFLLLVLALALFALWGGTQVRSLEQSLYDSDTASSTSTLLAQSFLSTRANLSRIDVQLSAFPNLSRNGEIRLLTGDGTTGTRSLYCPPQRRELRARSLPFHRVPAHCHFGGRHLYPCPADTRQSPEVRSNRPLQLVRRVIVRPHVHR